MINAPIADLVTEQVVRAGLVGMLEGADPFTDLLFTPAGRRKLNEVLPGPTRVPGSLSSSLRKSGGFVDHKLTSGEDAYPLPAGVEDASLNLAPSSRRLATVTILFRVVGSLSLLGFVNFDAYKVSFKAPPPLSSTGVPFFFFC